jgi:hypothetical protein
VDFYCSEQAVVIEVDGDVHGIAARMLRDQEREQDLQSLGLRIIRYPNDAMMHNVEGVLEDLSHQVLSGSTSPHPSLQRRGIEVPKDSNDPLTWEKSLKFFIILPHQAILGGVEPIEI